MKSILAASGLVSGLVLAAGLGTAQAEINAGATGGRADATLRGAPMSGPYETAFDEKCAEVSDGALRREATCKRVRALTVDGLRAEIHRVGWADGSGDYYLALRTGDGWFVSDVPLQIETQNGHAGHYDLGHVDSIRLGEEQLGNGVAVSFQIRETWRTFCDECATSRDRSRPERTFGQSATLVCGVGASGAPTCTAPLYTIADDDHPPRVVDGKLVARGVEIGEPTEYGQEWRDLADADYTIEL